MTKYSDALKQALAAKQANAVSRQHDALTKRGKKSARRSSQVSNTQLKAY